MGVVKIQVALLFSFFQTLLMRLCVCPLAKTCAAMHCIHDDSVHSRLPRQQQSYQIIAELRTQTYLLRVQLPSPQV